MLKQLVQFTDFDGANKTKNIYFNLTRSEVIDNIQIKDEFQEVYDLISDGADGRDMGMNEIRLVLELVKKLMRMAYGLQKQTDEGDLVFTKKPELWESFTETAAYDAFVMSLFEEPGKALEFLFGIWPKELTDKIDKSQLELPGMPVKMDGQPLAAVPDVPVASATESVLGKPSEYTREALLAMPKTQFDAIVGTDPSKMDPEHLQIAYIRKSSDF